MKSVLSTFALKAGSLLLVYVIRQYVIKKEGGEGMKPLAIVFGFKAVTMGLMLFM